MFGVGRYAEETTAPPTHIFFHGVPVVWNSKEEAMYDITIHPVLNGFVVSVGCQQVVFRQAENMFKEIDRYLTDPVAVEKEFREQAKNKFLMEGPQLTAPLQAYPG